VVFLNIFSFKQILFTKMHIKNWGTFATIAGYHVLLLVLLPLYFSEFNGATFALYFGTFILSGFAITAGHHRLFAHKTYAASPAYEWFWLFMSALAGQMSALSWSNDHRIHHSHVDTKKDPYNINQGFWYAHVMWLFVREAIPLDERLVSDLMKNKRVMFQHKHYKWIFLGVNAAVFGVGCLFMSPMASFVGCVLLRIFTIHHCTWFINSLAHIWGSRTYSKEQTAADNAVLAVLTFGEGYHNYHHTIANDYRNGIRWYHFDPTKWLIWTSSKIGLVSNLRWYNNLRIQQTLVKNDKRMFLDRIRDEIDETAQELRQKLEELSKNYEIKAAELTKAYRELKVATEERRQILLLEIKQLKKELRAAWKNWVSLAEMMEKRYTLAHSH
jgi:stearoyl-CoA desaturase (Delta-9 desaturase)